MALLSSGARSPAIVPILLGSGELLSDDLGGVDGYECVELVSSAAVAHVVLARR